MNNENELKYTIFPKTFCGKFVLRAAGVIIGEIRLPEKGVTFTPPELVFTYANPFVRIRLQFEYMSAATLRALRELVIFSYSAPENSVYLVVPGDDARGYRVRMSGEWRNHFFDELMQGYGPAIVIFETDELPKPYAEKFFEAMPWVVE